MSQTLVGLLPLILMMVLLYAVMIIPEKKRRKKYEGMLNELKVNDEILTKGGIMGRIITVDNEFIVLESGPSRARIKLHKNGIASVLNSRAEEVKEDKNTKEIKETEEFKEVKEDK